MASSSVSQESLDITEDYELNARRSRIRTLRARGALPRAGDRDSEMSGDRDAWDMNGDEGPVVPGSAVVGGVIADTIHDSPTRTSAAQRAKDKRSRPNHLQKGKLPKDKRKLREKRRSTGVVHLASTESTGDSLDDDLDEEKVLSEAKRNTAYNEVIDDDNPQTPSESKVMRQIQQFQSLSLVASSVRPPRGSKVFVGRRNKSPSDLEADLEDNQDYDSAVSQSDSNLTLIDHSTVSSEEVPPVPPQTYNQSKFSSDQNQSFKPVVSARESKALSGVTPSGHVSVLSRYPSKDSPVEPEPFKYTSQPRSPRPVAQTGSVAREPVRPVPSVLARYQVHDKPDDLPGYRSRFREREVVGVRGPIGHSFAATTLTNKENKEDEPSGRKMEKDLEREKDENRRLQRVLEEKDKRIAELERQVAMLNRDLNDYEDENKKLQIENQALIRAVGQLSTSATDV